MGQKDTGGQRYKAHLNLINAEMVGLIMDFYTE